MKYLIFNEPINEETGQKILDFIGGTDGPIQIGMATVGGCKSTALFIADAMNAAKDRLTLVAMSGIYSAGFRLFYTYKGKRKITMGCNGMYHYSGQNIRMNALGKPDYYEGNASMETIKKYDRTDDLQFSKQFMKAGELRKFAQAQEVYFNFGRMLEIFPDVEVIE